MNTEKQQETETSQENRWNEDSIHLLKECDAGTKMAVASIDEVLDKTDSMEMRQLLTKSREHHEKLGNEIHTLLLRQGEEDKEPNPIAKGMSWMKTNMKLAMEDNDKTIADLMTDGCDMGVKSLYRYLNQYAAAVGAAKQVCRQLIQMEEELRTDLHGYL